MKIHTEVRKHALRHRTIHKVAYARHPTFRIKYIILMNIDEKKYKFFVGQKHIS